MADNLPNLYSPNLSGVDPQSARIIRDLVERMNYLTTELNRVRGVAESASPGVDAAKKENPKAGIITIPATGGDGQSGLVRVNKDGVIVSYVNPSGIVPYQRNLFLDYNTSTQVVNRTDEVSLLGLGDDGSTKIVDPGIVRVGRTFRLYFSGVLGSTGTPNLDVRLKIGSVQIHDFTPASIGTSYSGFEIDVFATIVTLGSSGALRGHAGSMAYSFGTSGAQGATHWSSRNTNTVTVDFTVPQTWVLTAQWGTADLANNFVYKFGCIDIIR